MRRPRHQRKEHTDKKKKKHRKPTMPKEERRERREYNLRPKSANQAEYIRAIVESDLVIATGPAGSGKSHIATAMACQYWLEQKIDRIIITRPAVEATEAKLGFLPGDLHQKIHPYLVPVFDEMGHYFRPDEIKKMIAEEAIQVVPLNFMRGRNFHNAFVILDEGQNTTFDELKMFLTRTGQNTKVVINGDLTQSDIFGSGLHKMIDRLSHPDVLEGVSIIKLTAIDVVRSLFVKRLVSRIGE
jgi:phosphate starvation-inducible PhoH-like protein